MVPGFRCSFLPGVPSSLTSGSSIIVNPELRCRHGLRRDLSGSALPSVPAIRFTRARDFGASWFAFATACQVARPPVRIRLDRPAIGGFYFQAFNGSVSLPVAGYDYNSDWTPLLAGLSPAGMAASLAARSIATELPPMSALRPIATIEQTWREVRFVPILLQKSAYRRRGTVDAIFDAVVVTRWIVRATYARLY